MKIAFQVLGEPVAKGRAKFCVRGGFAMAYTPKKTREAEGDFRTQSLKYRPKELITSAIRLVIRVYKPIPKSMSKKNRLLIEEDVLINNIPLPITRPDFDNYAKLVCDSLNGIFWKDDSQICDCVISKRYSNSPRVEIELEGD